MKIKTLAVLILSAFRLYAFETNSEVLKIYNPETQGFDVKTNWFKTSLVTNWVNAPAYYRMVDGKIYNPTASIYWGEVSDFISGLKVGGIYANLEVQSIGKTSIICAAYENESGVFPMAGMDTSGRFLKRVLIYHHPYQSNLTTGETLHSCIAMRVENWKSGNISLEAYDCGLPVTNKLPVVKLVKVKIDSPLVSN